MALRKSTAAEYQRRILRVQQLIESRLDDKLEPSELARTAHLSLHHFHRIFRAETGESVMQQVRRLRLERAARKLRTGGERLIDLALEAGYESHEAFTRAFVERFGMPPSHYRDDSWEPLAAWTLQRETRPIPDVRVESLRAVRVAFMRHRGSYARVGETWQKLTSWASVRGLIGKQPVLYGICPDDPDVTAEALLRFDACVFVDENFTENELAIATIPGGSYAVATHEGSYDRLHETYFDLIGRWFPASGYELAVDPVVEHYLNDPAQLSASELRTEVRVRIAE